jgi:hypothetical protein
MHSDSQKNQPGLTRILGGNSLPTSHFLISEKKKVLCFCFGEYAKEI